MTLQYISRLIIGADLSGKELNIKNIYIYSTVAEIIALN